MSSTELSMATAALILVGLNLLLLGLMYFNMRREIDVTRAAIEKTNHKLDSIKGHLYKMRVHIPPLEPTPIIAVGEDGLYTCPQCGKKYNPVGPDGSVNKKCPDCLSKYPLHPLVGQI